MVGEQPVVNRIIVNSAEQDDSIESVTIFQTKRAEVRRRVQLDLKRGQNHIDIERLPSCINEDSIRVDGTGTAIIFDVVYHKQPYRHTNPSNDETVLACGRALDALRKERDIAKEQADFLGSYGRTLDSKSISIEQVERFLDMFGPRQVAVAKRIQELDVQVAQAEKEYQDAQSKVYADAQGAKRGTKITVTMLAEADGEAELMVTYVVTNASWTPLYDIRASIAKSPEDSSTVSLHYRASITQTTGENWPDVALTLSTASPQVGSEIPNLSAWRIGFLSSPPGSKSRGSRAIMARYEANEEREESDDDMGFGLFDGDGGEMACLREPFLPRMTVRQAQVTNTSVLIATFGISGRSDIPSDEVNHKVVITVLNLPAELEWICIPREKESVFLRCKVINSSEFTLLPGEASVFMNDNFVSKSRIEHVAPNDSFKTSLGTDPALRVSYPSVRTLKRTTTQSGFAFLAKDTRQSVAAHSQRITVRNSRPTSVSALRVLDHVPVSVEARLKVNVLSPNGLGPVVDVPSPRNENSKGKNKERPWVNIQKGVKAHWAAPDVGEEGAVEWMCEIAPTEELELDLSWEISAPVGEKWQDM